MRENLVIIGREIAAFFIVAAFLALMMGVVYIDVNWIHANLRETSLTETSQEILLAIIAVLFFWQAVQRPGQRGALILTGGFYSCMLIRELDFLFDKIAHGAWIWPALATFLICVVMALRHPQQTLAGLVQFLRNTNWQMMATGLLIVLVFSRLFGMSALWENLMLDGYNRMVKNMAEEVCELLGYAFCTFSSVRYLWQTRSQLVAVTAKADRKASVHRAESGTSYPQMR